MTMISLSGLDLSFLHGSAGGHAPPPKRPAGAKRPPAHKKGARLATGDGAMIIDLAKKRIELRGPASKKAKAAAKAVLAAAVAKKKASARAKAKRRTRH